MLHVPAHACAHHQLLLKLLASAAASACMCTSPVIAEALDLSSSLDRPSMTQCPASQGLLESLVAAANTEREALAREREQVAAERSALDQERSRVQQVSLGRLELLCWWVCPARWIAPVIKFLSWGIAVSKVGSGVCKLWGV